MTITLYANGTGGVLGDELVTETELYTDGIVYFVHHSGSDSNTGFTRQKPWATLVHALATISSNDIVVLLDGHTEDIAAPQDISQDGVKIVGEGSENGVPTVVLTSSLTDQSMLTLSGINIALGNIRCNSGGSLATVGRVDVTGVRAMIRGCYFEAGADDQWGIVNLASTATGARIFNSTFVNVSTTAAPLAGVIMRGPTDVEFEACTFDGGTVGFAGAGVYDTSAGFPTTAPVRLRAQQMRLMNGAGFLSGEDTTGYIGISEKSGAVVVTGFNRRLANGFRQTGDALLADIEFYMSGTPYYVHYGTGDDANSGVDELAPKKTLNSALSVASGDCDIVVLLPGHDEPTSATASLPSDGVTVIGCGTSDGKPSCKLHSDAADPIVEIAVIGYLRNVWVYDVEAESGPAVLVNCSSQNTEIRGCYIEGRVSSVIGCTARNSAQTYRESIFVSGGSAIANRPARGLTIPTELTVSDIDVRGCIFSNSQYGFEQYAFWVDSPVTRLYVIAMSQLYGADVKINSSTTGIVNPETSSGSASVEW